jgi:hypothetical protein
VTVHGLNAARAVCAKPGQMPLFSGIRELPVPLEAGIPPPRHDTHHDDRWAMDRASNEAVPPDSRRSRM